MKKIFRLANLDCANCAAELEREILAIDGVLSANVAFVTQTLTLEYNTDETIEKVIDVIVRFEDVKILEESTNEGGMYATNEKNTSSSRKKEWYGIVCSALFLVIGILLHEWEKNTVMRIFGYVCFAVAYISAGHCVLRLTFKNVSKGKIFDENFLMTVASLGAIVLGEYAESVLVMLLYQIGENLQTIAVQSSRKDIKQLMQLKSEWATVVLPAHKHCTCGCCHAQEEHEHEHTHLHGHEHEHGHTHETQEYKRVAPEEVRVGDVLLVRMGEKVPVDGKLLDGQATLDTKCLTGESLPRTYTQGQMILSGTINTGAAFQMRATETYRDSAVANVLRLVENAANSKAETEKFITKFARYYTPSVCLGAVLLAIIAPIFHGLALGKGLIFYDFWRWLQASLTFLVVSCPCALIISVPLTYFSGIGACAKQGALVKGANYLDVLSKAKTVAFDKTGTLTQGDFVVCGVFPQMGISQDELLAIVSAVEKNCSHPIAKAFEKYPTSYLAEEVKELVGLGVHARVSGEIVRVGNVAMLREQGLDIPERESVYTCVYVSKNREYIGCIEIGDKIRTHAKSAVQDLRALGFSQLVMLTGDRQNYAQKIANEVGMSALKSELLPDEKVKELKLLQKDGAVIYVGDGVNDAPVMAYADCAVSMGKLGSAAAVETSDLVLVSDRLTALPNAVKIARKTKRIVIQNIVFSIAMKAVFMVLGAFGVLPLSLAVFADVGVMLIAVCNSFRVRRLNNIKE